MPSLLLFGGSDASSVSTYVLTIDGVPYPIQRNWEIRATANGRAVMRFDVASLQAEESEAVSILSLALMSSSQSSVIYRPELDDEVVFTEDGDVLFGGIIESLSERGLGSINWSEIVTQVVAKDFNTLATRRYISETIPAGTLEEALDVIVTYIPGGVTVDPAQVAGPSLSALKFDDLRVDEALNYLSTLTGYIWEITHEKLLKMYAPGSIPAPFNIVPGERKALGDIAVEPSRQDYGNRIIVRAGPHRKQADDAAEQTASGVWEILLSAPDDTPEDVAQDLADSYLARSTPVLKKARYRTIEKGLLPGQTQTIEVPERDINNTFLITEMVLRPLGDITSVLKEVTASEGLVYQNGWRETYKRWNGSSAISVGSVTKGGNTTQRNVYPLGGSGQEFVSHPTPDWVPVSGGSTPGTGSHQVQINTVVRGTTAANVTARLRALKPGVTVKARLYDVTDNVSVGESGTVTGTSWQTVTFGVTLTPGSHLYEMQLLSSGANEPVAGVGYVE